MKRIALKIDVDTYSGTLEGVPALSRLLQRQGVQGTFFFTLGHDLSGRETRSTSLTRFYPWNTRLYGHILPSPDIGKRCAEVLRQTREAGHEVGIHAFDRADWEKRIEKAGNPWVNEQMHQACKRFAEIFSETTKSHAASGWRTNRHALRMTQQLGFAYVSDCRGKHPFIPVLDGEIVACPQIPTTLPTLDETLVLEPGFSPEQAVGKILELSDTLPGDHVFTLRAELEGVKFLDAFDHLLAAWKNSGVLLVPLKDIRESLILKELPRHTLLREEIPGRPGWRTTQGPVFLQDE